MLSEISALLAKPHLLLPVLAVGAFAGMAMERFLSRMRRWAWRKRNSSPWESKRRGTEPSSTSGVQVTPKRQDAADQLRTVMRANFTAKAILNKGEARVYKELDCIVTGCNPAWRVMAQVSLGEVLRCKDDEAYRCINSKRVDLMLMDGECQPRHAIEYQGNAHHQGEAAARDAVKREALRRAGIGYHEVVAGSTIPADLKRLVERLVDRPKRQGSVANSATVGCRPA